MKSIRFEIDGQSVEARPGESILEASFRTDRPVSTSCGGFGSCGACRIFVDEGLERLEPRNEIEAEMAGDRGFLKEERLACQTCPVPGLRISRPSTV